MLWKENRGNRCNVSYQARASTKGDAIPARMAQLICYKGSKSFVNHCAVTPGSQFRAWRPRLLPGMEMSRYVSVNIYCLWYSSTFHSFQLCVHPAIEGSSFQFFLFASPCHKSFEGKLLPLQLYHFFYIGYNLFRSGRVGMREKNIKLQPERICKSSKLSNFGAVLVQADLSRCP